MDRQFASWRKCVIIPPSPPPCGRAAGAGAGKDNVAWARAKPSIIANGMNALFAQGWRPNLPTVGGFCPGPGSVQRERFCYGGYNE